MIVLLQSDYQLPRMGLVILGAGSNRSAHCATPTTLLTMFMVWPQRVKAHSDLTQGYADSTVGLRQYRERKFPNFHVLHSVWMCHKSWCVAIKRCLDFDCFCFRKMEIVFLKKRANSVLFLYIFGLFKQTIQFLQQINVKNVHPVYSAGIRTHDLSNMSRPP